MSEQQKAMLTRWFEEVWNKGRGETINELLPETCVLHDGEQSTTGPEKFKLFYKRMHASFSEIRIDTHQALSEGDYACLRWSVTMRHTGDGLGMSATGKEVRATGMIMIRFAHGAFAEAWQNWDMLGLVEQIRGVKPGATYIAATEEKTKLSAEATKAMPIFRALVTAVGSVYKDRRNEIEGLKKAADRWNAHDFVWEALLGSFSTMGSSRGVELTRNSVLHDAVRFEALARLNPDARLAALTSTLRAAKVRMPDRKADWLMQNFERIQRDGGPESVKRKLDAQPDRAAKIVFLRTFQGIGPKYSRNLMMDVYHPDFRESIAVDQRIKKVSEKLGLQFKSYDEAEDFYLSVAHEAGLNGWEWTACCTTAQTRYWPQFQAGQNDQRCFAKKTGRVADGDFAIPKKGRRRDESAARVLVWPLSAGNPTSKHESWLCSDV